MISKKNLLKIIIIFLSFYVIFQINNKVYALNITLSTQHVTVAVGETTTMTVTVNDAIQSDIKFLKYAVSDQLYGNGKISISPNKSIDGRTTTYTIEITGIKQGTVKRTMANRKRN